MGIVLENALALGTVVVRAIIPDEDGGTTAQGLRREGYTVTEVDGRGRDGPVNVLNIVGARRYAPSVIEAIEQQVSRSFITVEELRTTDRGSLRPSDRRAAGRVGR